MELANKRSPLIALFATLFFTLPFTSNEPFYWFFYGLLLLIALPCLMFWNDKHRSFSLLQQLKSYHPILYYLLIAFALSSFVSWVNMLNSDADFQHKVIATQRYINCWLLTFYVFAMSRFALFQPVSHHKLFLLIAYGCLVLTSLLLLSYFFTDRDYAFTWLHYPPFGSHMRIIGMMLLIAIVACASHYVFASSNKKQSSFYLTALFICTAFLFWSGGRMSILAAMTTYLALSVLVLLWLPQQKHKLMILAVIFIAGMLAAEACSVFAWNGLGRIKEVSQAALSQDNAMGSLTRFGQGRIPVWTAAINAFSESPWFGLGPSGYLLADRPSWEDHTHNFIIECLVEWGLVGTLLMLSIFYYFAQAAIKRLKPAIVNNDINWITAAMVVFALTMNSLADGIYFILLPCFIALTGFTKFPFFSQTYVQRIREQYSKQ